MPKPESVAALDAHIADLEARLAACEDTVLDLRALVLGQVLPQVTELGIQALFMLRFHKIKRPVSGQIITDPTGKNPVEVVALLQVFDENRDAFVAMLEQEAATYEQNLSTSGEGSTGPGDLDTAHRSSDAAPTSGTRH